MGRVKGLLEADEENMVSIQDAITDALSDIGAEINADSDGEEITLTVTLGTREYGVKIIKPDF